MAIQPFTTFKVTIWTASSEYTQKKDIIVHIETPLGAGWDICDIKERLVLQATIAADDKLSWVEPPVPVGPQEGVVII